MKESSSSTKQQQQQKRHYEFFRFTQNINGSAFFLGG